MLPGARGWKSLPNQAVKMEQEQLEEWKDGRSSNVRLVVAHGTDADRMIPAS